MALPLPASPAKQSECDVRGSRIVISLETHSGCCALPAFPTTIWTRPNFSRSAANKRQAIGAVAKTRAFLFINDDWRLAVPYGAYGVHLGQEDLQRADGRTVSEIEQTGSIAIAVQADISKLRIVRGKPANIRPVHHRCKRKRSCGFLRDKLRGLVPERFAYFGSTCHRQLLYRHGTC